MYIKCLNFLFCFSPSGLKKQKGMEFIFVAWIALFFLVATNSAELALRVHVNGDTAQAKVSPAFAGVNIDAASLYQGHRLDFSDPTFRALAMRLNAASHEPMVLRIGGSAADDLTWVCYFHNLYISGIEADNYIEYVYQQGAASSGTIKLAATYWDSILEFCQATGMRLVYDLNAMTKRNSDGSWYYEQIAFESHIVEAKRKTILSITF